MQSGKYNVMIRMSLVHNPSLLFYSSGCVDAKHYTYSVIVAHVDNIECVLYIESHLNPINQTYLGETIPVIFILYSQQFCVLMYDNYHYQLALTQGSGIITD